MKVPAKISAASSLTRLVAVSIMLLVVVVGCQNGDGDTENLVGDGPRAANAEPDQDPSEQSDPVSWPPTSMSEDVPVAPTGPLPEPPMTTPPPTNVPPRPVELPDVVGERIGDVVSLLDMLGVRSRVVQAASNTGAAGMVTAADPPPGSQVAAGGTVELTYSPQRSQSEADAARDLIVDELAALPPSLRINSVVEDGEPTELVTAQGTWIISEPNPMWKYSVFGELPDGCVLGDPTGVYGKDFICVDTYREILLLDPTTGAIIRAYPFPELTPDGLVATDTAVYCNRQGDGGVPESLLCRIGLDDLKADVRIFPPPNTDDAGAVPKAWTPSYWAVDSTPDLADLAIFSRLTTTGSAVTASGAQGSATVDPGTLELSDITRQQNPGFGPPDMPPPNAVFDGVFTYWDVEDVQVNGRWITIQFTGGSEYDAESQCSHGYSIEAEETDDAVTLTITEWRPPTKDLSDLNVACTAVGFGRQVRVELDEPLRNRVIRKGY
ncbi:MAG: PASTA domain-containing protein [Acidimicrobiia bacterium]|nr:PASTA domain-containing protein [Acidimicrobiia bacterium]